MVDAKEDGSEILVARYQMHRTNLTWVITLQVDSPVPVLSIFIIFVWQHGRCHGPENLCKKLDMYGVVCFISIFSKRVF